MAEDDETPFEKLETAEDHCDRADRLVQEAETTVEEEIADRLPFEANVDASSTAGSSTFEVSALPEDIDEMNKDNDDFLVTLEPMQIRITSGDDPYGIEKRTEADTQRGRIKNLKEIIGSIEDHFEEGAPVEEVIKYSQMVGLDRGRAEDEIEKLRRKGEVYEPRQDHIRTT